MNFNEYFKFQYEINETLGKKIHHIRKYNVRGELGAESWVDFYDINDGKIYELKLSQIKSIPAYKGKAIDNSKAIIQGALMEILEKYGYNPILLDGSIVVYELPCGIVKFEIIKKLGFTKDVFINKYAKI